MHTVFPLHGGVRTLARLADDVLCNILAQDGLDLLLLEATFDDELFFCVQTACGSHFGQCVLHHVVVLSPHFVANVRKVRPNGLLCTFLSDKRRGNFNPLVFLARSSFWVALLE